MPVGSEVTYKCPEGKVLLVKDFEGQTPEMVLKCEESGVMSEPAKWIKCVTRKRILV